MCWDIFAEGNYRRQLMKDDIEAINNIGVVNNWQSMIHLENNLVWENKIVVVTDDKLTIQHVTKNMFEMNGYTSDEVIGQSPKMFQGELTEAEERKKIKMAVDKQQPFETVITNYKKCGKPYRCKIEGFPVFDTNGQLVNFIALENAAL